MTDAPKLLTEAEARAIYLAATSPDDFNARLRERGLIAEELDPLPEEADDMTTMHHNWDTSADFHAAKSLALAALRRGMELAPAASPLTREMFDDASSEAWEANNHRWGVGYEQKLFARLHAALTERPA